MPAVIAGTYANNYTKSCKHVLNRFADALCSHDSKTVEAMKSPIFRREIHLSSQMLEYEYFNEYLEYSLELKHRQYRDNMG